MKEPLTLYSPERQEKREKLLLTEAQKNTVRNITSSITEVDELARSMALEDVVATLENGHPLNRIITNTEGEVTGYIACEDFIPHEAYIKYFGTTGQTGRNLLQEIPSFLAYAKEQGYVKLNFHGWNDRLNRVLERYDFKRIRTDSMAGLSAHFYEKVLLQQKSEADVEGERRRAFEQKYLQKLNQDYQQTLATFSREIRQEKEQWIAQVFQTLSARLIGQVGQDDFEFGDRQKSILKLKLVRYFQNNDSADANVLFDAIIETPKFIYTDKGSFHRLLEVHEIKTIEKVAELRKKRAEMGDKEVYNPYEALFSTASGYYYMARLLNMPHLEEESEYMNHCVGTSDSYINKIKRGDIEILSFRQSPRANPKTGKLYGDVPVLTIEYNPRTKVIMQMKKRNNSYLSPVDPYFEDAMDALKKLRTTKTDTGVLRDFKSVSSSEVGNMLVKDYCIFTGNREVSFRDFNPNEGDFVVKMGYMEITPEMSREDVAKIVRIVEGIDCTPEEIAQKPEDLNENIKVYIGVWNPSVLKLLPEGVTHVYEKFPERRVLLRTLKTDPLIQSVADADRALFANSTDITRDIKSILKYTSFSKESKTYELVSFSVAQLGFPNTGRLERFQDICQRAQELGLDLCPAEVGPHLRLQYKDQSDNEDLLIAMKGIVGFLGTPCLYQVTNIGGQLWLGVSPANPSRECESSDIFVFLRRKV